MLETGTTEGIGDIGGWGVGGGDLSVAPVEKDGADRLAGYIKHKEMGTLGIVRI